VEYKRPLSFHNKIEVGTNLDIWYLSGNENPTLTFPQILQKQVTVELFELRMAIRKMLEL
jgi:hypothetical protein